MILLKRSISFAGLLCLLLACHSAPKKGNNEPPQELETLAILGTNDIHGTLAPLSLKTQEADGTSMDYEAGGASTLASYIHIIRSEFGEHFIWLDGGDQFQGSIESNLSEGSAMVEFFNTNHVHASAIGNHEFDFGLPILKKRMDQAKYPYLAANILEKATGLPAPFPNTFAHTLITAGKLKVGIIGLSTLETPTTTRAQNVRTLLFDDLKMSTLRQAQILRERGAHIVLLTAHVGLACDSGHLSTSRLIRKPLDPQGECGSQHEMVRLLQSLPAGTIDAVISGHTHKVIHHWVAGVPVIQGGAFGRYINIIYLTYSWNEKRILTDQTRIEGPIPICSKVFQNQNDCNGDRPAPKIGRGPLISPEFHGEMIYPDPKTQAMIAPFIQQSEKAKSQIVGQALRPINYPFNSESALGNLVTDAILKAVPADVALMNTGGIRAPIQAGPITYGDVFRSFPFDNEIVTVQVTGQELTTILRVAESGSRGFGAVSGAFLKLIDPKYDAPRNDLNGDGLDSAWKTNRLISITLSQGEPLELHKIYTLATSDFLLTGGDDLGWPMSLISADRIQMNHGMMIRDAIVNYLQKSGPVNGPDHPLVDPNRPRFKFETPVKSAQKNAKKKKSL